MATKNVWNKKAITKVSEISVKALNITGQVILNQNILGVTPLKTGDLRKSLVVENATIQKPRMRIVSKGSIAPYNVARHEIKAVNYTTPGTDYKFLENTFRNNASKTFNRVLKGEMKKNGY